MEPRKTPLYEMHVQQKARLVDFHGWMLPVQYTSIVKEHNTVRSAAGLFDVSHMGVLDVIGPGAQSLVDLVLTNNMVTLRTGRARYSLMCNEKGGTVDDVVVYKINEELFRIVVNAANTKKDLAWIAAHNREDAAVIDHSDRFAMLALQGPRSSEVLRAADIGGQIPTRAYSFVEDVHLSGIGCMLARTGYTGELGYEILCAPDDAPALWNNLLSAGKEFGVCACGLGARDSLRLEAGMPLYGHELSDDISPLEAGLNAFVDMDKPDFIGREALLQPVKRVRLGFQMQERGIPREGYRILDTDGCVIGVVTSGGHSPTLNTGLGMALIQSARADCEELYILIREKPVPARKVPLPFYIRMK
ncbi:MAG: glycine cleavage system aminomethyltransferase GcvT [Bacillota bacterium]